MSARQTHAQHLQQVTALNTQVAQQWAAVEQGDTVDLPALAALEQQSRALQSQSGRLQRAALAEQVAEDEAQWHASRAALLEPHRQQSDAVRAAYLDAVAAMTALADAVRDYSMVIAQASATLHTAPHTIAVPRYGADQFILNIEGTRLAPLDVGHVLSNAYVHGMRPPGTPASTSNLPFLQGESV